MKICEKIDRKKEIMLKKSKTHIKQISDFSDIKVNNLNN